MSDIFDMEIQTLTSDKDSEYITLSAPGTIVGLTVSAIVFTTITTTADLAANVIGTGIELSGNILAYSTEFISGPIPAHTIQLAAKSYSDITKPIIRNTSRIGALGISILAGTSATFTTNVCIYGGKRIGSYLYSCYESYSKNIINTF